MSSEKKRSSVFNCPRSGPSIFRGEAAPGPWRGSSSSLSSLSAPVAPPLLWPSEREYYQQSPFPVSLDPPVLPSSPPLRASADVPAVSISFGRGSSDQGQRDPLWGPGRCLWLRLALSRTRGGRRVRVTLASVRGPPQRPSLAPALGERPKRRAVDSTNDPLHQRPSRQGRECKVKV